MADSLIMIFSQRLQFFICLCGYMYMEIGPQGKVSSKRPDELGFVPTTPCITQRVGYPLHQYHSSKTG